MILSLLTTTTAFADDPRPGLDLNLAKTRAQQLSEIEYTLHFTIPQTKTEPFAAQVEISFKIKDVDQPVILDFKAPPEGLKDVQLNGQDVAYKAINQHLILRQGLKVGVNHFALKYNSTASSINRDPQFVYTLFVPDRASQAFPCFDQPDLKANFILSLDVPQGWLAVSNEKIVSSQTMNNVTSFKFAKTPLISTYLFAFAAGKFQLATGRVNRQPINIFYRESDQNKVKNNLPTIISMHNKSLKKLEVYTGIAYPFSKFDIVLLPAFQFGGMEHPGTIFYREDALLLDPSASTNQIMGRANLIAHETSHMWFGDLVTMKWFDDVWLKEVMANFFAAKVTEPMFPRFDHRLKFYLKLHPNAYDIDRSEGTNSIRQRLDNLQDAGSIYGEIIYSKSPVLMRQLETLLGEKRFRQGLQDYLRHYQFNNATWDDLLTILNKYTKSNLQAWNEVWIDQAGRPEISHNDNRILQIDPQGKGRIWPQKFLVLSGNSKLKKTTPMELISAGQPVALSKNAKFVLGNSDGTGYGFFRLDTQSLQFFLQDIASLSQPLPRAVAWTAIFDEFYAGNVDPNILAALCLKTLQSEKNELIIDYVLNRFNTLYWTFLSPAERSKINSNWEQALWLKLMATGHKEIKPTYWKTFVSISTSEPTLEKLINVWNDHVQIPDLPMTEADKMKLAFDLALRLPRQSEEILNAQALQIKNPDRRAEFEFIRPSLSADEKIRQKFFFTLKDAKNRQREPWVIKSLSYLAHPLRPNSSYMVRPGLEWLEDIQRSSNIFFPMNWISTILQGRQSPLVTQEVRDFLREKPQYPVDLKSKILQSADFLFRASKRF